MKNVTCRKCGHQRVSATAEEGCCMCGSDEITLKPEAVTDIINSRSTPEMLCSSCGKEVFGLDIDAYPHKGGWQIPGLKGSWWLSVACPSCNHETSFCNFGINR